MIISRRNFAAAAATGILAAQSAYAAPQLGNPDDPPQGPAAIKDNPHSSNDPGPKNTILGAEFPSSEMPPSTDHGDVPNFWFPFAQANKRVQNGGWARQVTVNELPIAKSLAGVDMYLTAGAIREMHWHLPAEWAFVLYGKARITGFDQDGRSFVADVGAGDLWNFPSGIPHSIQGLDPDGTEFLLVFDDGAFSEFDTFLPSQWMAHTPVEVLVKNFNLPASAFAPIPLHELYIFQSDVPGPLQADQKAALGPQGATPESFSYSLLKQPPDFSSPQGEVRIINSKKFFIASTVAAAHVIVHPGAMREMHWHPNADEWQYYIAGSGRMGDLRRQQQRPHQGLPRRRRRLYPARHGPLHREHRQYGPGVSRSISQQLLLVDLVCAVAQPFADGAGQGPLQFLRFDDAGLSKQDAKVVGA